MKKDEIINILSETYPFLISEDIELLLTIATYKKCANKEEVITANKISTDTFFILKGMVRGYYVNEKGDEINLFLRPARTISGSPDTLIDTQPSKYTFQAVQQTHLLVFPYDTIFSLGLKHSNIHQMFTLGLMENLKTIVSRIDSLVTLTPEERYNDLLKTSPELFKSAFNKHIASYLGMTPVSLSRISKRKM